MRAGYDLPVGLLADFFVVVVDGLLVVVEAAEGAALADNFRIRPSTKLMYSPSSN